MIREAGDFEISRLLIRLIACGAGAWTRLAKDLVLREKKQDTWKISIESLICGPSRPPNDGQRRREIQRK